MKNRQHQLPFISKNKGMEENKIEIKINNSNFNDSHFESKGCFTNSNII